MPTCREIAEFLMEFLDGGLPWRQRTVFRIHVWLCPPCRRYLAQYRRAVELGKDACDEPDEVPDELVDAIVKAREK